MLLLDMENLKRKLKRQLGSNKLPFFLDFVRACVATFLSRWGNCYTFFFIVTLGRYKWFRWIYISTLLLGRYRGNVLPNPILKGGVLMKTEYLIKETLKGLLATAKEKLCVLGEEDAKEDLKKLREVYEDLVLFWGLNEELIDEFDEKIGILK